MIVEGARREIERARRPLQRKSPQDPRHERRSPHTIPPPPVTAVSVEGGARESPITCARARGDARSVGERGYAMTAMRPSHANHDDRDSGNTTPSPPFAKTPRISSRMTSSPLSKPPSEGGGGNTGTGAMAEEATREEKIPPLHLNPRKHHFC